MTTPTPTPPAGWPQQAEGPGLIDARAWLASLGLVLVRRATLTRLIQAGRDGTIAERDAAAEADRALEVQR